MKRFTFPLEKVLRFRELIAETEAARLEGCLARVREIDARLAALDRANQDTMAEVRASFAVASQIESSHLVTYPDYRFLVSRSRDALVGERSRAMAEVSRQRAILIEARRACEVLSRAKQLARERWQAAFLLEQENTASELFLSGWKRRRR